ncbi:MAG: hypothetical protein QXK29_02035 [Candidatus Bathyarchaeia archaeon]
MTDCDWDIGITGVRVYGDVWGWERVGEWVWVKAGEREKKIKVKFTAGRLELTIQFLAFRNEY